VVAWLPGQGARQWLHDAADHVIEERRLDRAGRLATTTHHRYDAAGRPTQHEVRDAQGQPQQTHRLRYEGAHLSEDADDVQLRRFEYDAAGRVTRTTVQIKDEQGRTAFIATLASTYDATTGEVSARRLADGSVMHVQRAADTGVAQHITLQSAFWSSVIERIVPWLPGAWVTTLQKWLPQQIVAANIAFHPYNGITNYIQGNGMETDKRFDIAGRLQALQVKGHDDLAAQTLRYDVGRRIRGIEDSTVKDRFDYDGFGRLKVAAQPMTIATQMPPYIERDAQGRTLADGSYRYTYTPQGQVQTLSTSMASGWPGIATTPMGNG
jgi:YD repeat-containing protein